MKGEGNVKNATIKLQRKDVKLTRKFKREISVLYKSMTSLSECMEEFIFIQLPAAINPSPQREWDSAPPYPSFVYLYVTYLLWVRLRGGF